VARLQWRGMLCAVLPACKLVPPLCLWASPRMALALGQSEEGCSGPLQG